MLPEGQVVSQEGSHSPSGRLMAQRSGPPTRNPVLGWSVHTERGDWPVTPSSHGQRLAILSLCICGCRVGTQDALLGQVGQGRQQGLVEEDWTAVPRALHPLVEGAMPGEQVTGRGGASPLRTGAASPPATHAEGAEQGDQGQVGRREGGKRGGTV